MIQRIGLGDFPRRVLRRKPPLEYAMFDSVTVSAIPVHAVAVAGYVNGMWPTFPEVVKRHPRAKHLSIAVTADTDAECLDVERGDATIQQAPAWVKWQRRLHPIRARMRPPMLYTSVSSVGVLLDELARFGIKPKQVRIWSAHYTYVAHICGPHCGFGMPITAAATQWTDKALGQNLDESLCSPRFL